MITGQGKMETTPAGALRESNKYRGRFDLLPYEAIEELAIWYELGAEKYEPRNWEKGLSVSDCINRMVRHALKAASGWMDENHLAAVMWNAAGAITMMRRRPDLNDHRWIVHDVDPNGQEYLYSAKDVDAEMTQKLKRLNSPRVYPDLNESDDINSKTSIKEIIRKELDKFKPLHYDGHTSKPIGKLITEEDIVKHWQLDPEAVEELKKRLGACGIKDANEIHDYPNKPIFNSEQNEEFLVQTAERITMEKILKMFVKITLLDAPDRELLRSGIEKKHVDSLVAVEEFLRISSQFPSNSKR